MIMNGDHFQLRRLYIIREQNIITDQILAEEKQNLDANQPVAAGSVPSILASKAP